MPVYDMLKLLTVFALGAAELFLAIPAGFALKLNPLAVGISAALGGLLGVSVIVVVGSRVRGRLLRDLGGGNSDKSRYGRVRRIWERYGVVWFGLLAPILLGPPLGTAMGLMLGAPTNRLLLWMGLGVAFWSAALTLFATLGLALVHRF